jgi:hypothetical protein
MYGLDSSVSVHTFSRPSDSMKGREFLDLLKDCLKKNPVSEVSEWTVDVGKMGTYLFSF